MDRPRPPRLDLLVVSFGLAVAIRSYDTTVEDRWDAITTPGRLAR